MFFGVLFLFLALAAVPLLGGRLGRLSDLQFDIPGAGVAAVVLQWAVLSQGLGGDTLAREGLHVASYGLMAWFVARNLSIPGLWIVALGGASNGLAIAANGGVMPASAEAYERAGLDLPKAGEYVNSRPIEDPQLGFLGDVFATPSDWPMANVFSVGDILVVLGILWLVLRWCRTRPALGIERGASALVPHLPRFDLLRENRSFRRLWTAQLISNLGDWIYPLAVFTAAVGDDAGASSLAFLVIAQIVPAILTGFFGGPLIDRFPRRLLLIVSDAMRFLAVGSLLLVDDAGLWHLYAVAVALGIFGALFQPTFQASLPNIVPRDSLAAANALVGGVFSAAIMLGPVIGALLISAGGIQFGFAMNALSFLASAVMVAGTVVPQGERRAEGRSHVQELRAGLAYMSGNPTVRSILIVVGLVTLAAGIKSPLEPLLALKVLDVGPTGYGILGGFWGAGMAIGFFVSAYYVRRFGHGRVFSMTIVLVGFAVLGSSISPVLWPIFGFWVVAGAANTIGTVAYETLLLERTPDAFRGRVMAAAEAALEAGLLIGVLSAGVLAELIGTRGGLAVSGVMFLFAAVVAYRRVAPLDAVPVEHVAPQFEGMTVLDATASLSLVRVTFDTGLDAAPVLLVDDGSRVHRLDALPGTNGHGAYGYSVPRELLRRRGAALALDVEGEPLLDLPRP
jgi:MFS family permease